MILEKITKRPTPRSSRIRKSYSFLAAEVSLLENRLLLSAVDDSASLDGNQPAVEIDVLANDTGIGNAIVSVGKPTNTTNGGTVSITNGKIRYSLPAGLVIQSLGDYTIATTTATLAISKWHAAEVGHIGNHFSAVNTSIDRFGSFLARFSGGMNNLSGTAGSIGAAIGGNLGIVGKALGYLAKAAASNIGGSNATIINAAHQMAASGQTETLNAAARNAQRLGDSLTAQVAKVGTPTVYSDDSFTYVGSEMQIVPMPGMPGLMMTIPVFSTATVSVAANITDYSAMVMNVDNWRAAHEWELNLHIFSGTPDLDRIYGDILRSYARSQGWKVVWQSSSFRIFRGWFCAMTDKPYILDGTDIATELNAIGYKP